MATTATTTANLTVKITMNDRGNPPGKLADAELHFGAGPLDGLKLIGFSVWERRSGAGRNVTFPARQYAVNGERRSFALLRPIADTAAQDAVVEIDLQLRRRVQTCEWEGEGEHRRVKALALTGPCQPIPASRPRALG
jgi:hypothetical protein